VESDKYEGAVQELKDKGVEIILEDERATGGRRVHIRAIVDDQNSEFTNYTVAVA
jgi:hypothetical protein